MLERYVVPIMEKIYYINPQTLNNWIQKNMKKEQEQKKEYTSPEMKIVELRHELNLMQGSGSEPPPWSDQLG